VLSPYWLARSVAKMLLYRFRTTAAVGDDSWMRFLPTDIAPPEGSNGCPNINNKEAFRRMCDHQRIECDTLLYAHKCSGWELALPEMSGDTQQALAEHANTARMKLLTSPSSWRDSDMVLWDRCAHNTVCAHSEHAPIAFSGLEFIPSSIKRLFYVYANDSFQQSGICQQIQNARIEYLKQIRSDVQIILDPGDIEEDFAKLVFSPNVIVVSAGSSFALWSTLANTGNVWMPAPYGGNTPYVRPNYHWLTQVPALTTQACRNEFGITVGDTKDVDPKYARMIVEWLQIN